MDIPYLQKIKDLLTFYTGPENRITSDEYFASLALLASLRGTCARRKTGAVLVNERKLVISTGYNGNAPGLKHCINFPCSGAHFNSGVGLDKCEAIHAEINAIIHCKDPSEIHTAYTTNSPCIHCVKALLATPCKRIVFIEKYPHPESEILWKSAGRIWEQI